MLKALSEWTVSVHIPLLFENFSVLLTSPIPINSNKNRVEDNEVRQGGGGGRGSSLFSRPKCGLICPFHIPRYTDPPAFLPPYYLPPQNKIQHSHAYTSTCKS